MKKLRGKTALVTGASRGIGVYIVKALAREGMHLVLAARSRELLEKVESEVATGDLRTLSVPTDVGDRASLEALAEAALDFGGVDVLVNNAGIERGVAYDRIPLEAIDRVIEVNLTAPMVLTRLLLPQMLERGGGQVVNVASVSGLVGTPYNEVYSATKHGLIGFTRSLRVTAIGEGYPVGASAVCPGFVADAGMYEDMRKEAQVDAPALVGTVAPERVADAVVRAIVDDVPEILVNARPLKPLLLINALFPRFAEWFGQKSGVVDLFKRAAEAHERQARES